MAGAVSRCIQRYSLTTPTAFLNTQHHIRQPFNLSLYKLQLANYSTESAEKKELTNKELVAEKIKVYILGMEIRIRPNFGPRKNPNPQLQIPTGY